VSQTAKWLVATKFTDGSDWFKIEVEVPDEISQLGSIPGL
jgi:hypothetical protein